MDAQLMPVSQSAFMPFVFEGMALKESCWMNGKPYFTYRAIGEFLEYEHPDRSIHNLVKRNPHILTFRTFIKLMSVEGSRNVTREVEVVDPIGLQLVINKSNQPKAIAFQVAAAHLVYAFMAGELKPSKWSQRGDLVSAARQILSLPEGRKRKRIIVDLAEREGLSLQQTYRRITMATGERLKGKTGKPRKPRSDKDSHKNTLEYIKMAEYLKAHPTAKGAEIKRELRLNIPHTRINAWIRETGQKTVH